MRSPVGVITRQIELSRYAAMIAAYDAQIRTAQPGTPEHGQLWRDRTTYAALMHPDADLPWMRPDAADYGHVPEQVTAELDIAAELLAAQDRPQRSCLTPGSPLMMREAEAG